MCQIRHADRMPKDDGITTKAYCPSSSEVDEALTARRAFKQYLRHGELAKLDNLERKSLSAFSFGNNGFLLAPERSNSAATERLVGGLAVSLDVLALPGMTVA